MNLKLKQELKQAIRAAANEMLTHIASTYRHTPLIAQTVKLRKKVGVRCRVPYLPLVRTYRRRVSK